MDDLCRDSLRLAKTPDQKRRRSLILQDLPHTLEPGHRDRQHYLTIAQAWNVAVGRSMNADCDSAFCFRGIYPLPINSGLVLGRTTFNVRVAQEDRDIFESFSQYSWHPADLSWDTISKICSYASPQVEKYQDSLVEVQVQTADGTGAESAFAALLKIATPIIAEAMTKMPKIRTPMPPILALSCEAAGVIADNFDPVTEPLSGEALKGVVEVAKVIRDALVRREAHRIGRSLMDFGLQYNLHRVRSGRAIPRSPESLN